MRGQCGNGPETTMIKETAPSAGPTLAGRMRQDGIGATTMQTNLGFAKYACSRGRLLDESSILLRAGVKEQCWVGASMVAPPFSKLGGGAASQPCTAEKLNKNRHSSRVLDAAVLRKGYKTQVQPSGTALPNQLDMQRQACRMKRNVAFPPRKRNCTSCYR